MKTRRVPPAPRTATRSDEIIYTRRQAKIIDAATKTVSEAERDLEAAEDALSEAKMALKLARRELERLHELGDCL